MFTFLVVLSVSLQLVYFVLTFEIPLKYISFKCCGALNNYRFFVLVRLSWKASILGYKKYNNMLLVIFANLTELFISCNPINILLCIKCTLVHKLRDSYNQNTHIGCSVCVRVCVWQSCISPPHKNRYIVICHGYQIINNSNTVLVFV